MISEDHAELLAVAEQAVRTDGAGALDVLGWWDLLGQLDDPDLRPAAFAVFRAQGRALVATPAVGGLLALPHLEALGMDPGSVVAAVPRRGRRRGAGHVVVGPVGDRAVLVDLPGRGVAVATNDELGLTPLEVSGHLDLREVTGDLHALEIVAGEDRAAPARERAAFLGRVALAAEILGAAEGAVALALTHATDRVQFGEPIGRFQAVRHLLAWADTDCVATEATIDQAVALDRSAPPRWDEVTKALAGRNGRKACERSLQVLGGIGFTAEHDHHHHHGRVLALDALCGTSAELTRDLGAWLRDRGDPGYPRRLLLPVTA